MRAGMFRICLLSILLLIVLQCAIALASSSDDAAHSMHDHHNHHESTDNAVATPIHTYRATGVDCVVNSSNAECVNFQLPNVSALINANCQLMPNMPGCSIHKICHGTLQSKAVRNSVYCGDFSIYKDICMNSHMPNCSQYHSMCATGSVVKECQTKALALPSTSQLWSEIEKICTSMPMSACSKCPNQQCPLLDVYSDLCLSMPDMSECSEWSSLCDVLGSNWPLCPSSNDDQAPIMRMYFHTGMVDYVLFKGWVPRTTLEYIATLLVIVLSGVLYEGLKMARVIFEERYKFVRNPENVGIQEHIGHEPAGWTMTWVPFRWHVDLLRSLFSFTEVGLGLLLMLVAMTFNVGMFLAVCVGALLGSLLFSRFTAAYKPPTHTGLCH